MADQNSLCGDGLDMRRKTTRHGFLREEDGSFIIFGLFIFILILTAGGLGVDFMRYETQRARLQSTLDRAVLAAASLDQPLDPTDVVLDYFDRAGLQNYITADDITVVQDANSRHVEANANMHMNTTLLKFSGIDSLDAPAGGAAEEKAAESEISLVLDVSGSMGWYSNGYKKIDILKDAATKFVNLTTCDPSDETKTTNCTVEPNTVSLSIVPYSEQVLVGENLLSLFNVTNEQTWSSCVTFTAAQFQQAAIDANTPLQRTGHFDPWRHSENASSRTCKTNSWRKITPVEGDGDVLRARIAALGASGNTSIDVGMKWGTALLDPAAQPVISGVTDPNFPERPYSYERRGVEKVIVLMTDGVNTSQHYLYDSYRSGNSDVWRTTNKVGSDYVYSIYRQSTGKYYWPKYNEWHDHAYGTGSYQDCNWQYSYSSGWQYICQNVQESGGGAARVSYPELWKAKTWYWFKQFSWLGNPGSSWGNSTKNARLNDMCNAAKAEDITVFTIGFETDATADAILKSCASDDNYYFNVDGLDLSSAFASIAREISKLRLVN